MDETTYQLKAGRLDILGVPVDPVDMRSAIARVRDMLRRPGPGTIYAVNPEKVVAARQQPPLLEALRAADLLVPDGIGVVLAARLSGQKVIERVPGSELMPEICALAATEGHPVFLYGARPDVVTEAAGRLRECYPGLKVAGVQHGYLPESGMDRLIERINASRARILFVALGSPRQEIWMHRYRDRLDVSVCQGVGGTLDAICGRVRRAPEVFRKCHLEWFYRLATQPGRAGRQKALPKFAVEVLRERLLR